MKLNNLTTDEIRYALAKQIPDMARGVTLSTCYGEMYLEDDDALAVQAFLRLRFEKQLAAREQEERRD